MFAINQEPVLRHSTTALPWLGLAVALSLDLGVTIAGHPELEFDFSRVAVCRDVETQPEPSEQTTFSRQRVVEVKLRVSVRLLSGRIDDVEELRIEIEDCDHRLRVDSYSPGSQMQSDYTDDITVTKTVERGKSLSATLGGEAPIPLGDAVAAVLPGASSGLSKREVHTEKQSRHAPRYAVVTSGTIRQEHGVFFKLHSSAQTHLEGAHEFAIRFVVPESWRGDSLRVCCSARGHEKFLWTRQQATWSKMCAAVAVYQAGDLEARQAAEEHVATSSL